MDYKNILLKQNRDLFHTSDLELLWGVTNKNTVYTIIKRYVKKGVLHRIHKGFYSTKSIESINPIELGIAFVHDYAYLSTEYVLSLNGVINQHSSTITLISTKSLSFTLGRYNYIVREMKKDRLFNDIGIEMSEKGYKIASPERATIDMFYYNRKFHIDNFIKLNKDKFNLIKESLK